MARIIGEASVRVSLDSTGFKDSVKRDVTEELENAGNEDFLGPGLKKNEDEARKSTLNISSIFSTMWQGVKSTALAYLGSLVPAAANSLIQLSGLLGLIPAAGAAGASVLATLALGMHGFTQAVKDLGDPKKFAADIASLAPSAREAAKGIQSLKGQFSTLQLDVQQQLFLGLGAQIKAIGAQYLPILDQGLSGTAGALNAFIHQAADFLKFPDVAADFKTTFANINAALRNLVPAWDAVLSVMDDVVTVGGNFLPKLATSIGTAAAKFAEFINNARISGQLAGWIQTGIDAFHNLITIVGNVASIVLQLFGTLDATGGNLLSLLANLTGELKAFLASAEGQQLLQALALVLRTIATDVGPLFLLILKEITPIIVQLAPLVAALANAFAQELTSALKTLGPILQNIAKFLTDHQKIVVPLAVAITNLWIAWKAFTGLQAIVALLTTATAALGGMSVAQLIVVASTVLFNGAMAAVNVVLALSRVAWALFTAILDANPFILIGVVIVGLAVLIATHWTQTVKILTTIWKAIASVATTVWNAIAGFFTGLWNSVSSFFVSIWNSISTFLIGVWTTIVNATRPIWEPIAHIIGDILTIIKDLFVIVFDGIAIFAIAIWNEIVAQAKGIWTPLSGFFIALWNVISDVFKTTWAVITAILTAVWNAVVTAARAVWEPIADFFITLWDGIKLQFEAVWNAIKGPLLATWNAIVSVARAIWQPIANFFSDLWNGIKAIFTVAWDSVVNGLKQQWNAVVSFFSGVGSSIIHALGDVGSLLINAGKSIIEGFLKGLENAFDSVKNFVGGIASWVSSHKGPIQADRNLLVPHGTVIMQGLIAGMASQMPALTNFLTGVSASIAGSIGSPGLGGSGASLSLGSVNVSAASATSPGGGSPSVQINAYQQPGQDVLQFASAVSKIGAQSVASAASLIAVTQQPVQIGATNKVVPVG